MINLTSKHFQLSPFTALLTFAFAYIEQKKQVDFNKKCIQLMQKPSSPSLSSDFLKLSNQYNSSICSKIFYWMNKKLSIGESTNLIVESDFKTFEEKTSYRFLRKCFVRTINDESFKMEHLELHKDNNLVNYIAVIIFFERNQDKLMTKVMMAILANFLEKGEEIIHPLDYSRAMSFLTSRCYISSNVVLYFKSLSMDLDFLNVTINRCEANEIVPLFETVANTLQSALNIERMQYNDYLKEKAIIISPQNIKQMTEVYFKFLENPHMYLLEKCRLPLILDIPTVENILIKDLFPTHKKRLLKIIKNIFNPFTLSSVKVHPNLVPLIFDQLFTFSSVDDKEIIVSILSRYTKSVNSLSIEDKQDIWGGNSLIFLCEKFKFVSESLFVHIGNRFSKNIIYFKRPKKLIKPILDFNNALIKEIYTFGIFLKMLSSSGVKIQEESWFINNFLKKFEYYSELQRTNFEYFTEAITLDPTFKESFDIIKRTEESQESGSENEAELFKHYTEKVEKEIDVTYNNELMERIILSPNLNLLEGSKLKILIENMINYCEFSNNSKKLNELCSFLNLEKIIKIVKKHISYPGLVEVLFTLYYTIGPKEILKNYPLLDSVLQGLKNTLNKKLYLKILSECEAKGRESNITDIKHMKNADSMFNSGTEAFNYEKLEFMDKNFEMEAVNFICKQNNSLKNKFVNQIQQLIEGEENGEKIRLFPFFVEYPFIADYLLIWQSNVSLIFFVSELEKLAIYSKKENYNEEASNMNDPHKKGKISQALGKYGCAIKHFQNENYKIIFVSNEEDIKNFITTLEAAKKSKQ